MLSALSALFRILLIAGAVLWLARLPGELVLNWQDYVVSINVGFLLGTCLIAVVLLLILHRAFLEVLIFPKFWRWYQTDRRVRKGLDLQAEALNALAAEDAGTALQLADKSQRLLPEGYGEGLSQLVKAQAARQAGKTELMLHAYQNLADHKSTAILGLRGQIAALMESNQPFEALHLIKATLKGKTTRASWVWQVGYDLAIQTEDWDFAWDALRQCERQKLLDMAVIRKNQVALLALLADRSQKSQSRMTAQDYLQQAYKLAPGFTPIVLRLAELYRDKDKDNKARHLIERAWVTQPHPQLVALWDQLVPSSVAKKTLHLTAWRRNLAKLNPGAYESHLMLAEATLAEGLWGEAKAALQAAEEIANTQRLQKLWARYEDVVNRDEAAVKRRLLMVNQAAPDPVWFCTRTGRIYPHWMPLALPHRSFNTVQWGRPEHALALHNGQRLLAFPDLAS
jgi:HemY protein